MKERPILMSTPMVLATLDGTKTQTRRAVKSFKSFIPALGVEMDCIKDEDGLPSRLDIAPDNWSVCPYGVPGDQLWVREAFSIGALIEGRCSGNSFVHFRDGGQKYRDGTYFRPENYARGEFKAERLKWKPSIHMPRWASRIQLEIVSVRVERLQDISEADAIAEGVPHNRELLGDDDLAVYGVMRDYDRATGRLGAMPAPIARYVLLWDSINGEFPRNWNANPYVWAVEFKRIKP